LATTSIYELHDPRDWSIRYVGKANNPERRHLKSRSHNAGLQRFISELRALGLKPRVTILQTCSQDQWQNWERFWITTVKAAGEKLLNLHPGGDGPITARAWNKGLKMSEEQRARMVFPSSTPEQCRLARLGKKDSEETRLKKSLAAQGRKFSSEHRAKLSSWQKGKKKSPECIAKMAAAKLGKKRSPEFGNKHRETMLEKWNDPCYREKVSAGLRESWRKRLEKE